MITPRRTRLLRVPSLSGLRSVLTGVVATLDPLTAADTFVLVPTRAAGEQLRRTVEDRLLASAATVTWPRVGPRSDFYRELFSRAPQPLALLSPFDREVILGRLAREVDASGIEPPFAIRPALVAEMLALYDHVRRQARTVEDFDRNLRAELEPAVDTDRGAAQLLRQTRFLTAVFEGYEQHLIGHGLLDEHGAREAIVAGTPVKPVRHVVVTVADRVADADGLWPVDFTLLSTVPSLEQVDVVATEAMLAAGFLERIHAALPGLEEMPGHARTTRSRQPWCIRGWLSRRGRRGDVPGARSRGRTRARGAPDQGRSPGRSDTPLHKHALVVRRPLPYLYLARSVFGGAGLPFETLDTLPLAAEPYAAALDLVLDCIVSGFSRSATIALLRSPHFQFDDVADGLPAESVSAFDRALADARYLGGIDWLARLADVWSAITAPASRDERKQQRAAPAARVALAVARELAALAESRPVPTQMATLLGFLSGRHREPGEGVDIERLARVRRAVSGALAALGRAYAEHDPEALAGGLELSSAIRRWLGAQTFAVRTGVEGVRLLDAQAARFADVDDVQLVGLVEGEWPERTRRSIFYPPFLLGLLDPTPAAEDPEPARKRLDGCGAGDVPRPAGPGPATACGCPRSHSSPTRWWSPPPSSTIWQQRDSKRQVEPADHELAVFADEALIAEPPVIEALMPSAQSWAALRAIRPALNDRRFSGEAGPWVMPRVSVSRIDRYLKCPFQFFASEVLELEEEPDDEDAPPPLERGRFLHALFESFFREWQRRGRGPSARTTCPRRAQLLVELSEARCHVARAEAALERPRCTAPPPAPASSTGCSRWRPNVRARSIAGSSNSSSTRVLFRRARRRDADRPAPRQDRSRGPAFWRRIPRHRLQVEARARLEAHGSAAGLHLRRRAAAAQGRRRCRQPVRGLLPVDGRADAPIKALSRPKDQSLDDVLMAAEQRMVQAIDDIGAGHFPARPMPRSLCAMCPFDSVCRKQFVEAVVEATPDE